MKHPNLKMNAATEDLPEAIANHLRDAMHSAVLQELADLKLEAPYNIEVLVNGIILPEVLLDRIKEGISRNNV